MKNKTLSILLTACLAATMLAGCGGSSGSAGSDSDTDVAAEADASTGAESAAAADGAGNADDDAAAIPQAQIEETVILDDENITATITGIDYSYTYPLVTMTITNNHDDDYSATVQPRFAVNGCMTSHGYYLGDTVSVDAGESSNYAFFLYDNQYYGVYPASSPIQSLDVAVYVEGYDPNTGDLLYNVNGQPLSSDDQDYVISMVLTGAAAYEQVPVEQYIYIPRTVYESDYVHIDTDLADASTGSTTAPTDAAALLDEDGCSMQYVDLIQTLDGSYAYVFYVENTNDTARTVLCNKVSANGTPLSAHSSQFYLEDAADIIDRYASGRGYPFNLPMYLPNTTQRAAVGYNVPYTALTVAPQSGAYLILPLDKDGLATDGVSLPLTSAEFEFSIASAEGEPILCTANVSADSAQAELRAVDVSRQNAEPGLSTWITNSTDYNYNLIDTINVDEADDADTAFLTTALRDIAAIDTDKVDVSTFHKYQYSASSGILFQGLGYKGYSDLEAHDGYARYWFLDLYPSAEYGATFSAEFLSSVKQALLDSGYTTTDDTWYEQTTNNGSLHVRVSIYDYGENISIYASPVNSPTIVLED